MPSTTSRLQTILHALCLLCVLPIRVSHEFEVISIYNTPHLVLGAHVLSSSNHPLLLKPHMNAIRIVQLDPRQLVFKKYFRVLGLRPLTPNMHQPSYGNVSPTPIMQYM